MHTQSIRHVNLTKILEQLESEGYISRESQALYLGGAVTAGRLESMLAGADIPALFASRIEHVMFKPKGWMSTPDTTNTPGREHTPSPSGL